MLFTEIEVHRGIWCILVMMGHAVMGLLDLFSAADVANAPVQQQVMILTMAEAVEVLQVVERMMLMDPGANDDSRINLTVQVLETMKSGRNLLSDDPLQMMCCSDLRNCC